MSFRRNAEQPASRSEITPVRSFMNNNTLSLIEFTAILLPLMLAAFERGIAWLWLLFTAVIASLLWQRIFSEARHRPFVPDGLIAAMACAIILPASAPLWQVALSLSFGVVLGQEIFGGRGRNFLNPATMALAFFIFSFPGRPLEALSPAVGLSVVPGAFLLLISGVISWRVIIGAVAGLLLALTVTTTDLPPVNMAQVGFIFGLVFLAADPVAAASTNPGRWLHGFLVGSISVLLARTANPTMETVVSACLLASMLAPLIDSGVLALNLYQRGRRHG